MSSRPLDTAPAIWSKYEAILDRMDGPAVASLEDVLIAKLEWSRLGDSALQRRDVAQLLERTWMRLDQGYVERWVAELGLQAEWGAALSQAKLPGSRDAE